MYILLYMIYAIYVIYDNMYNNTYYLVFNKVIAHSCSQSLGTFSFS